MAEYRVKWEIDVEADSHEEAARIALEIQRDPESTATFFMVRREEDGDVNIVDGKDWEVGNG